MPWFKSPDGLANSIEVMAIPRRNRCAAMGLWLMAGTWCSKELTDGFVPAHMLPEFAATKALAGHLVAAGLWEQVPGGYQFVAWSPDQPTRAEVEAKRAEARRRMKRVRDTNKGAGSGDHDTNNGAGSDDVRANDARTDEPENVGRGSVEARSSFGRGSVEARPTPEFDTVAEAIPLVDDGSGVIVRANFGRSAPNPDPTRPDPYIDGHLGGERPVGDTPASSVEPPKHHAEHPDQWFGDCAECNALSEAFIEWKKRRLAEIRASENGARPPARCLDHLNNPNPPNCGRCLDARRRAEEFDAERARRLQSAGTAKREGIAACAERRAASGRPRLCDDAGWRIPPPELEPLDPPAAWCDHFDALPAAWVPLLEARHAEVHPKPAEPTEDPAEPAHHEETRAHA